MSRHIITSYNIEVLLPWSHSLEFLVPVKYLFYLWRVLAVALSRRLVESGWTGACVIVEIACPVDFPIRQLFRELWAQGSETSPQVRAST